MILACFHDLFDLTEIDGSVVQTRFVRESRSYLSDLIDPTRKVGTALRPNATRSTPPEIYGLGSQPAEALVFLQCGRSWPNRLLISMESAESLQE